MTIQDTNNSIEYTGDGVTVAFAYNFRVDRAEDMKVYFDLVPVPSGWQISGLGEATGGTVTFNTAPAVDVGIVLVREIAIEQLVDYKPYDPFPANTQEFALDKLTMICQDIYNIMTARLLDPTKYARLDEANEWEKSQVAIEGTVVDGPNISWDPLEDQVGIVTIAGDRTLDALSTHVNGGTYILTVVQDVTGGRSIIWGSMFKWENDTPPILAIGANERTVITFLSMGSYLYGGVFWKET